MTVMVRKFCESRIQPSRFTRIRGLPEPDGTRIVKLSQLKTGELGDLSSTCERG